MMSRTIFILASAILASSSLRRPTTFSEAIERVRRQEARRGQGRNADECGQCFCVSAGTGCSYNGESEACLEDECISEEWCLGDTQGYWCEESSTTIAPAVIPLSCLSQPASKSFGAAQQHQPRVKRGLRTTRGTDLIAHRIVGGRDSEEREFRFLAQLHVDGVPLSVCGGSLISPTHVLTAAHCGSIDFVVLGGHDQNRETDECREKIPVKRAIVHSAYNDVTVENDIMILELESPSAYGSFAIPMYASGTTPNFEAEGTLLEVAGWGTTAYLGTQSALLQKVEVPVYDQQACYAAYQLTGDYTNNIICAGIGGKDSCQGDSGGPLFARQGNLGFQLVGIVSWGIDCAVEGKPGVYTKVSQYTQWVLDTIGNGGGITTPGPITAPPTNGGVHPTPGPITAPPTNGGVRPTMHPTLPPTVRPTLPPSPTPSGCDDNTLTFTFETKIESLLTHEDVFIIPAGSDSVRVVLFNEQQDLDLALFDMSKENQAIVAWCGNNNCLEGVLGMDGLERNAEYSGLSIKYSGYNGVRNIAGYEFIEIQGTRSAPLMVKAMAYSPSSQATSEGKVTIGFADTMEKLITSQQEIGGGKSSRTRKVLPTRPSMRRSTA